MVDVYAEDPDYAGEWYFDTEGVPSKDYSKTVFVCAKFTDADGNVSYSNVTGYSPESYAQRQIDRLSGNANFTNLVDLCKRLVIYGEASKNYFGISVDDNSNVTTDRIEVNNGEGAQATVPAGVKLNPGVSELTLSVVEMEQSGADITTAETEETVSFDVHIDGIASDNGKAIIVDLGPVMPLGLNMGNYRLYHVEDGVTNQMTMVNSLDELDAHNEFFYDPATGNLTVAMATFSEVALVSDTENAWNGKYDYKWYDASAKSYTIANADQLAAFGAIMGGMAADIAQDDFDGKTVTLLADIDLGGAEDTRVEGKTPIFYPIGYYNSIGSYEKQPDVNVTSGVSSFEGTFDGQGHTIKNFYQNTWEMFGDYNNGYSGTPNHYKDAMGLFGYVYNGTVKNLNVDNFSSDGEFTPTGVIAAYACNATFENIAITNCNPRVYNTGNGGIVGIGGNDSDTENMKLTFSNITIDNSNKITALWGSWDVACGGLVGMFRGAGYVDMNSCHVAAQLDVYNDVCGNYQYYWYRYAGMMVGTNKTMVTDANGYTVPETSKYHASDCTVHFGEWNDYYYCELVANSLASYTHDHQFSRLTPIASLDEIKDGEIWTKTGNFLFEGECYHIVSKDGELVRHFHEDAETETVNGETVLKEDKQIVYLPFNQLFTGYGWGVKHIPVYNGEDYAFEGITILDREVADSVEKFAKADSAQDIYTTDCTVTVGELFKAAAIDDPKLSIKGDQVQVSVSPADDESTASGSYTANAEDWTQGTVTFSGTGAAVITISDYYFCTPTTITVKLVNHIHNCDHEHVGTGEWKPLSEAEGFASGLIPGGKYYLTENTTLSNFLDLKAGDVTLCLNGCKLDSKANDAYIIRLYSNNLDICDCSTAKSGVIGGGWASSNGATNGAIIVRGNCTLNMYGGSITGVTNSKQAVYVAGDGTFNMHDGTITGNNTNTNGAVHVLGTFNMHGGVIADNTVPSGKGQVTTSGGTFNQSGGDVGHAHGCAHNHVVTGEWKPLSAELSKFTGGVLPLSAGHYYLDENITLPTATGTTGTKSNHIQINGDVTICLNGNTLNSGDGQQHIIYMNGAYTLDICDCSAGETGTITGLKNGAYVAYYSAIIVRAGSTVNLYGGTITGNKATSVVYVANSATATSTFNMYGGKITGNDTTKNDTDSDNVIKFNLNAGAVHVASGTFNMYGGEISGNTTYDEQVTNKGTFNQFGGAVGHAHGCTHNHVGTGEWKSLNDALPSQLLPGGKYYLEDHITLENYLYLGGNVTLCLNGKTLTGKANDSYIINTNTYNLDICDCSTEKSGVIGGNWTSATGNNACSAILVRGGCTLNMYGGTITGVTAPQAVYVPANGTFNMHGGAITGNNTTKFDAVYVLGTFNMYGGDISGNTVPSGKAQVGGTGTINYPDGESEG